MTSGTLSGPIKSSHSLWRMRKTKCKQWVNGINSFFWRSSPCPQILISGNSGHLILLLQVYLPEKGTELVVKKAKLKIAQLIISHFSYTYILYLREPELKGYITNSLFKWYFYYPLNISQCVIIFTLDLEMVNLRH